MSAAPINVQEEQELDELQFLLSGSRSPKVIVLTWQTPRQRARLIRAIQQRLPEYDHIQADFTGIRVISLMEDLSKNPAMQPVWAQPRRTVDPQIGATNDDALLRYVVHITGLEGTLSVETTSKERRFLPQLNFERELIFRQVPALLILWLTPHTYRALASQAVDFFSWVSMRITLPPLADDFDPAPPPPPSILPTPGYTPARKARVQELETQYEKIDVSTPDGRQSALRYKQLLAKEYEKAQDYLPAAQAWRQVIGYLAHLESPSEEEQGEAWLKLGNMWTEARHWDEAEAAFWEAEQLFLKTEVEQHFGRLYHLWGMLWQDQRQWATALGNYQKAIEWKEKTGNEFDLGGTYHQIGMAYAEQRQWEAALENYQKALEWQEKTGNEFNLGNTYHQIGMAYAKQRQWEAALENYQKALEWNEKTGNEFNLGGTYHQIGIAYTDQHQWAIGLENYQKALEWKEKTGNEFGLGSTYHQIGYAYADQRQWEAALENYQKALEWQEKTGNEFNLGNTYHQIGMAYAKQRQWEAALENYQKALEWNEKTGNEFDLADTYYNIGLLYEEQGRYYEALAQYEYAWELAEKWDVKPKMKEMILTALENIRHKTSTQTLHAFQIEPPQSAAPTTPSLPAQLEAARGALNRHNPEAALSQAEQIIQAYAQLPPDLQAEDRDCLAEAHLLAGIAYGLRAGKNTRSNPEIEHLTAAYEQAKSLLLEGDTSIVELYLEAAYHQIASLQKVTRGFFGSKKAKQEIAGLRAEAERLTEGVELPEAASVWREKIGALQG